MIAYQVRIGSIVDLETGVVYSSRTECIEALGWELVVPILHSSNKTKRLRIVTVEDRIKALHRDGEETCVKAAVELDMTKRDLAQYAEEGWNPTTLDDAKNLLKTHVEAMDELIDALSDVARTLCTNEQLETLRSEFRLDIYKDVSDMVSRL